jgi:CheY-like chemotaxis protein
MNVLVFCYDADATLMTTKRPTGRWPKAAPRSCRLIQCLREEGLMTAPRIVLLGNDSISLSLMHTLLIEEGYRTLRCRPQDVTDAHAVVKRAQADLVILDLWLAKRADGWAFLRRLRADLETADIPAIIASGQPEMPPEAADLLRTMACHVMVKPFDAEELLRAIETALGPSPVQQHRGPHLRAIPAADPLVADLPDLPDYLLAAAEGL